MSAPASRPHAQPLLSCEFFPPNSPQAAAELRDTRRQLLALAPEYYSVTYGAAGSTRNRTFEAVMDIRQQDPVEAAPHLTCIASTRESVHAILEYYRSHGIRRIVALRGDLPGGMRDPGELRYANELVAFIRESCGEHFHIEVAAYPEFHPQASSPERDLQNFCRKVAAGANAAITQYFFNPDAYFRFRDDCARRGVHIPIVPGIMPITNYKQLARFSDQCGAEIPRWIRQRLEGYGDDLAAIRSFGLEVVTELCRRLLQGGAPGLHFYTMNQAAPTLAICRGLGLIA
ncbi:MAG TPA: methylenetetrahydrofolate reductase [NAD(P)H] [Candidatus Competibacteraceae bacterium]|nr:methylenetetrahydrofolate reductase [NAD(P)H] [Candidatus Competibacteraceae bacterium]